MTALEFIQKDMPYFDPNSNSFGPDFWIRKMEQYAVIKGAKLDIFFILNLDSNTKKALFEAAKALYLDDSSGYKNALYEVVHNLTNIQYDDLEKDLIKNIFDLLESNLP